MGLDMYLERFPRYKHYGPKDFCNVSEYADWEQDDKARGHTFTKWCGVEEEDLPKGKDFEKMKGMCSIRYYVWDKKHRWPHMANYDSIAYWRKANEIHKWFVDTVQDGVDDCEYHDEVTEEKIKDLINRCEKILESAVLVDGKVKNGYKIGENGEKIWNWENGRYVLNKEICEKYLPCEDGYFFGSTEYDEWYMEDIKYTYEVMTKILKETDFEKEMIYYSSSW